MRAVAAIYADTPGVDWVLYVANHGSNDAPVSDRLEALDAMIEPGASATPELQRLHGSEAAVDDWQPLEESVKPADEVYSQTVDFLKISYANGMGLAMCETGRPHR